MSFDCVPALGAIEESAAGQRPEPEGGAGEHLSAGNRSGSRIHLRAISLCRVNSLGKTLELGAKLGDPVPDFAAEFTGFGNAIPA